jgi:hypothetical protein
MEQTTSTNLFGDIVKLEQYRLPGNDVAKIVDMPGYRGADDRQSGCPGGRTICWPKAGRNPAQDQLSSLIQPATASGSMAEKATKMRERVQQVLKNERWRTCVSSRRPLQIPVRHLRRVDQRHPGKHRRGEGADACRKIGPPIRSPAIHMRRA